MPLHTLLWIAAGLAMDACAVAVATSAMLARLRKRQIFRFAFHFGLFQALMPILGWLAGQSFARFISGWDHWAAFGLLAAIGGRAVFEAVKHECEEMKQADPTRGWTMVGLAVATSLDALAVGLSFALLGMRIWYPAAVIGLVTAVLVVVAMLIGSRIGRGRERWMKLAGGIVLIAIGIKILIEDLITNHHLFG
jgi:manganese efflux pump family protein